MGSAIRRTARFELGTWTGARSADPDEVRVSRVALLLIDVINPMDFEGAEALLPAAIRAAKNIADCGVEHAQPRSRSST